MKLNDLDPPAPSVRTMVCLSEDSHRDGPSVCDLSDMVEKEACRMVVGEVQ